MFSLFRSSASRQTRHQVALRDASLFAGLSEGELVVLRELLSKVRVSPGETLIVEGKPSSDLFVIGQGSVEVLKIDADGREHSLDILEAGEVVGAVGVFDGLPSHTTARVRTAGYVWRLSFQEFRDKAHEAPSNAPLSEAYDTVVRNATGVLSLRLRHRANASIASVQRHGVMGRFIVNLLLLLCAYVFLLQGLTLLGDRVPTDSRSISIPIQVGFGVASWGFIRSTGFPLARFGIGWACLWGSLFEALIFTGPVLALLTGLKWVLLQAVGTSGAPLLEHPDIWVHLQKPRIISLLAAYAISSAVQELIVRGALQSSLEMFLVEPQRVLRAIFVSALLFSLTHLHISFIFATLAFLPGLFWGWLYSRQRNLLGVTLSHIVIGGYVFFVLGVRLS